MLTFLTWWIGLGLVFATLFCFLYFFTAENANIKKLGIAQVILPFSGFVAILVFIGYLVYLYAAHKAHDWWNNLSKEEKARELGIKVEKIGHFTGITKEVIIDKWAKRNKPKPILSVPKPKAPTVYPDNPLRTYNRPVPTYAHLMTVEEWLLSKNVSFGNYDGSGYWVKDDMICNDEVFTSNPQDATHVAWFDK